MRIQSLIVISLFLACATGCGGVETPEADSVGTVEQRLCITPSSTKVALHCNGGEVTVLGAPCGPNGYGAYCGRVGGGCAIWTCNGNPNGTPITTSQDCQTYLTSHLCNP